jgi:hypothetical protein
MLQTFLWIDPDPGERIKQELLFSKRFLPQCFLAQIGLAPAFTKAAARRASREPRRTIGCAATSPFPTGSSR